MDKGRRDFLKHCGLAGISAMIGAASAWPIFSFLDDKRHPNVWKIYNELPLAVHTIFVEGECSLEDSKTRITKAGRGIIYGDKFLTLAHVANINSCMGNVTKINVYLYGVKLEKKVIDPDNDLAVFNLPKKDKNFKFPGEFSNDIYLGKEVYIIGDPGLKGNNIRKVIVSDLNGVDGDEGTIDCFGVDSSIIPGDSGTPVVDSNLNVLGLCRGAHWWEFGGLGYVKKIKEFEKYL